MITGIVLTVVGVLLLILSLKVKLFPYNLLVQLFGIILVLFGLYIIVTDKSNTSSQKLNSSLKKNKQVIKSATPSADSTATIAQETPDAKGSLPIEQPSPRAVMHGQRSNAPARAAQGNRPRSTPPVRAGEPKSELNLNLEVVCSEEYLGQTGCYQNVCGTCKTSILNYNYEYQSDITGHFLIPTNKLNKVELLRSVNLNTDTPKKDLFCFTINQNRDKFRFNIVYNTVPTNIIHTDDINIGNRFSFNTYALYDNELHFLEKTELSYTSHAQSFIIPVTNEVKQGQLFCVEYHPLLIFEKEIPLMSVVNNQSGDGVTMYGQKIRY